MRKKAKKQKSGRVNFVVDGAQVEFVPYSDMSGIGYIRLERRGEYLYSFDGRRKNEKFLRHLKATISDWLKELK